MQEGNTAVQIVANECQFFVDLTALFGLAHRFHAFANHFLRGVAPEPQPDGEKSDADDQECDDSDNKRHVELLSGKPDRMNLVISISSSRPTETQT